MFNLYNVVTLQEKNTVLGMEMSNVFEARHFVLKFMQICKNTQQCSPYE